MIKETGECMSSDKNMCLKQGESVSFDQCADRIKDEGGRFMSWFPYAQNGYCNCYMEKTEIDCPAGYEIDRWLSYDLCDTENHYGLPNMPRVLDDKKCSRYNSISQCKSTNERVPFYEC
jgi:hypothetical protein